MRQEDGISYLWPNIAIMKMHAAPPSALSCGPSHEIPPQLAREWQFTQVYQLHEADPAPLREAA